MAQDPRVICIFFKICFFGVVSKSSSSSSPLAMMASHHVDRYFPLSQRSHSYEGCNVRHVAGDGAIDPSDSDESDSNCLERDSDSDSEGKGATAIQDSAFNETTAAIRSYVVINRTEAAFLSPQSCEKAALYVCGCPTPCSTAANVTKRDVFSLSSKLLSHKARGGARLNAVAPSLQSDCTAQPTVLLATCDPGD